MPFDFQAYIAQQKPADAPRVIVQDYAYVEDMRRLRQLLDVPLLPGMLKKALKAWSFTERLRLRHNAKPIKKDPRSAQIWRDVCLTLGSESHEALIIPDQKDYFTPYTDGNTLFFGLSPACCALPTNTMRFVFGRGLGAAQNDHVTYMTLAHFVNRLTRGLYSKAELLADALLHWQSSANITQDRAGLLACHDISAAIFVIMKSVLDWSDDEIMNEIRRYHAHTDVDYGESEVKTRVMALEFFAKSSLYAQACGLPTSGTLSMTNVDKEVLHLMVW